MEKKLLRRRWVYIQEPSRYEIHCDLCGGEVMWSEYRKLVWCWRCLRDTPGDAGVFDGPFPMDREFHAMLGISVDRIHIKTGRILRWELSKSGKRVIWKFERTSNDKA
jgi:hypothetical protein